MLVNEKRKMKIISNLCLRATKNVVFFQRKEEILFPGVDQGCGTSTADGPAKSLEFNQQHVAREGAKK